MFKRFNLSHARFFGSNFFRYLEMRIPRRVVIGRSVVAINEPAVFGFGFDHDCAIEGTDIFFRHFEIRISILKYPGAVVNRQSGRNHVVRGVCLMSKFRNDFAFPIATAKRD
jgi:hypothetical protein